MKIAIVHEMLVKLWWAENVVKDFFDLFPNADLYTLIYDEKKVWSKFPKHKIKKIPKITQFIYKITGKQYLCLPFMKNAIESLDFSEYDLVISSSSWFAHWCITKPETIFIVYYHTPARFLWDWTHNYTKEMKQTKTIKSFLYKIANNTILRPIFSNLRKWDYVAWQRYDFAIAASNQVKQRIYKYYKRNATTIYPPVYVENFSIWETPLSKRSYYVIVSALTAFKKIDLAVKAFNQMWYDLYIIWDWEEINYLKSISKPNIRFLWYLWHNEQNKYYSNARWAIMPWRDDFWIVPLEAMASWVPMFWLREWWLTETSIEWLTWEFFDYDDTEEFKIKFQIFHQNIENNKYDKIKIRSHALKFNKDRFLFEINNYINKIYWL